MIRILVPLDGSPAAERAIQHAAAISRVFLAEIELIGIIDNSNGSSMARLDSVDWQLCKHQTKLYLSRKAEALRQKDLNVSYQLREGDAALEIIQHINENTIDLLVLSRYGKGEAQQFSSGGTAQKVISASPASVLLIDPEYEFDDELGYRRILVPVDGGQRSELASSFAAMVAQAFNGSLHLLQIVEEPRLPGGTPISDETRRLMDHIKRKARSHANCHLNNLSCKLAANIEVASTVTVSEDVAMTIESVAEKDQADLLVIAAKARHDHDSGRYGPTCETLLAHVRQPVLVLRSEDVQASTSNFRSVFLDESCADAV